MLRLRSRLLSFSIVSHKIAHSSKDYHKDPTLHFVFYLFNNFSINYLVSNCWT
jgi:hypothetical protein